jgi:FkbM family methyltransferase
MGQAFGKHLVYSSGLAIDQHCKLGRNAMNTLELTPRLERLLAEDRTSILKREVETLESSIGSLDKPFVLYGAGNLGRKVLKKLNSIGKQPVAFIDNNAKLWGADIQGVPVMSPSEASRQFEVGTLGVITTIWCGEATDKMSDRIDPIRALGFNRIALFGHLAWKFQEEFLPHYCLDRPSKVIEDADDIRAAFDLLSDDESRRLFVDHVDWRLFLDYDLLPLPSEHEIYFNDHYVNQSASEVLYDIGAYSGDSLESFVKSSRGNQFAQIHCFEPSPNNFISLQTYLSSLGGLKGKVFAHQLALGDSEGTIQVETGNGPASRVGVGSLSVPMATIDQFSQTHASPTFIKIDIEGFEPQCLRGAEQVIRATAPVIAVCVYHMQAHLWQILLQLHSYYPGYSYSLCPHLADGWDLVLYAVPASRKPA